MAKDGEGEVEIPFPGQDLSMAVPSRTTGTLHLLSILQNVGQDLAKSYNSWVLPCFFVVVVIVVLFWFLM